MRLLAAPVVAVVLVVGVWVAGGLITDEFLLAMWLIAAWVVLVGVACSYLGYRRRRLALPVALAYVLTAGALAVYLGSAVLLDHEVHEDVATAETPPATPPRDARARPRNVQLARGRFESVRHPGSGVATAIRLAGGGRVLTLTRFDVSNGPDLRVYLVAGPAASESDVDDYVDLGGLKGNKGDQQYVLPADVDLRRYGTVVIWCRAFSVLFARAPLEHA